MPKEDNDKSAEDLFPDSYGQYKIPKPENLKNSLKVGDYLTINNEGKFVKSETQTEYIVVQNDNTGLHILFPQKNISYITNKIMADPITEEGDCRRRESLFIGTFNYNDMIMWQSNIEKAKQKERYCFFLDIDGTLLKHFGDKPEQFEDEIEVLPGVREFFQLCGKNGHIVILTSGRRESFRKITEKQLRNACIPYDKLILGCTNAIRVLVNDTKPYREDSPQTAIAFNLVRDEGVQKLVDFLKGNNNGT